MALSVNITPTRVAPGATVTAVVTGTPAEIGRVFVPFAGGGGWGFIDAAPATATDTSGAVWTVASRTATTVTLRATARRGSTPPPPGSVTHGPFVATWDVLDDPGGPGVRPARAGEFTNSLCVVVHPSRTTYVNARTRLVGWLRELGAGTVRTGWAWDGDHTTGGGTAGPVMRTLVDGGLKLVVPMSNAKPFSSVAAHLAFFDARLAEIRDAGWGPSLRAIEGQNEPNNRNDDFDTVIKSTQEPLYNKSKAIFPTVPVLTPALIGYKMKLDAGKIARTDSNAPITNFCNGVAAHSYFGDKRPYIPMDSWVGPQPSGSTETRYRLWYAVNHLGLNCTSPPTAGGPKIWWTETGYHNYLPGGDDDTGNGVTEAIGGRYSPIAWAAMFRAGAPLVTFYELMDETEMPPGDEQHYGLRRADGTPKPAFTALARLSALVKDTGTNALTFTPAAVQLRITGAESLVLAKSDGSYLLLLWHNTDGDRAAARVVSTGRSYRSTAWTDLSTTGVEVTTARTDMSFAINDHLTVVKLTPAT